MKRYKLLKQLGEQKAGEYIDLAPEKAKPLVDAGILVEGEEPAPDVNQIVAEELKVALEGVRKSIADEITKSFKGVGVKVRDGIVKIHDNGEDDPKLGFRDLGEQAKCIKAFADGGLRDDERMKRLTHLTTKADGPTGANEGLGEDGGLLIAPEFSQAIYEVATADPLALLNLCQVYNVQGNSMRFLGAIDDDKSDATKRHAGILAYWIEEGHAYIGTHPKFRSINQRLKKLGVLAYATDEMQQDGGAILGQFLTRKAGEAIADEVDESILLGNGVGKPLGMFHAANAAIVTQGKVSNQTADTVRSENITGMWKCMSEAYRRNALWLFNGELEDQFSEFTLGSTAGGLVYMPPGGLTAKPFGTLFGRPVRFTDHCEKPGDLNDAMLFDPTQYYIITKGGIGTAMSIHLRFDYAETAWRFTFRLDGAPAMNAAVKPRKGSTNFKQSAYVNLEAR